jgi:hypothetical protein
MTRPSQILPVEQPPLGRFRLFDRLRTDSPQLGHTAIVEVLPKIHTVGDLVDFVAERLGPAASVTL